ncbi:hypothetical protein [Collimonas humicola]|uniref:hypothetical protein n=1 Tax=Collimonas humicola TaxID=2825886 RepID=UPI001B8AFFDB|nr:hypothetical protein [Collimonas humicola]
MNYFKNCLEILNWLATVSFRFRPKSNEAVEKGLLLAETFDKLSLKEKSEIVKILPSGLDMKLLALSGFMAEAAINKKNADYIKGALVLHLLENFRRDYRENIRYIVLIAFAANEIGINFSSVIDSLSDVASVEAKRHLNNFSARDKNLNKLSSFGIKAEVVDGIFYFSQL